MPRPKSYKNVHIKVIASNVFQRSGLFVLTLAARQVVVRDLPEPVATDGEAAPRGFVPDRGTGFVLCTDTLSLFAPQGPPAPPNSNQAGCKFEKHGAWKILQSISRDCYSIL